MSAQYKIHLLVEGTQFERFFENVVEYRAVTPIDEIAEFLRTARGSIQNSSSQHVQLERQCVNGSIDVLRSAREHICRPEEVEKMQARAGASEPVNRRISNILK